MKIDDFPKEISNFLIPKQGGKYVYKCLSCKEEFKIDELLYVCPKCSSVLMLEDKKFDELKKTDAKTWRKIFDYRKMLNNPKLKGIYRFYEFIGRTIDLNSIVYLGEGSTPIIEANSFLKDKFKINFYFKNDGQNPSASFKDRGMASALSYINFLIDEGKLKEVLAICASTGDTSAAAALYSSYLNKEKIKSAVILPHKKVTPQQLSQPLGNGATVFEIPAFFDDCMKIVERLSENYNVALLNSKNAWRILGQESYSYEIAQDFEYDMKDKVVVLPIGNAGNITAIMNGFLKFYKIGIIDTLPKIIGVQSEHANPVFKYYSIKDKDKRVFKPVKVKASVAQAAMIGNPVSMPRVINIVDEYNRLSDKENVFFVDVLEQEIMDMQLLANQNGHIICTQGGESFAGLIKANKLNLIKKDETAILDSTAHMLKFASFQQMYFDNKFDKEFQIKTKQEFVNKPKLMKHAKNKDLIDEMSNKIAKELNLQDKT